MRPKTPRFLKLNTRSTCHLTIRPIGAPRTNCHWLFKQNIMPFKYVCRVLIPLKVLPLGRGYMLRIFSHDSDIYIRVHHPCVSKKLPPPKKIHNFGSPPPPKKKHHPFFSDLSSNPRKMFALFCISSPPLLTHAHVWTSRSIIQEIFGYFQCEKIKYAIANATMNCCYSIIAPVHSPVRQPVPMDHLLTTLHCLYCRSRKW